jgi:hypothetical protein
LKRYAGETIAYVAVLEFQKNGYAHLHVLIDRNLPFHWIQESWQALGGGKFVNIKPIDIHRVAPYLSKYLTKEVLLSSLYGKFRRFTTSRGIVLFVKPPKGQWRLLMVDLDYLVSIAVSVVEKHLSQDGNVLEWFGVAEPVVT